PGPSRPTPPPGGRRSPRDDGAAVVRCTLPAPRPRANRARATAGRIHVGARRGDDGGEGGARRRAGGEREPRPAESTLALVEEMTGGKALPGAVRETILDWSDGVPLFVEELTRQLLESGPLRDVGEQYVLDTHLAVSVPATLHDLLVARLDALGSAKLTAQIASTLGRSFSLDLLRAVAPATQSDVAADVDQLCSARILEVVDDDPEATRYAFRHTLLREAAYHAQLKARRREVHRGVARALEESYPGVVESEPEMLAHHLAEGGEPHSAADYLLKAGQKALHASAVQEAITHLSHGVELVQGL